MKTKPYNSEFQQHLPDDTDNNSLCALPPPTVVTLPPPITRRRNAADPGVFGARPLLNSATTQAPLV